MQAARERGAINGVSRSAPGRYHFVPLGVRGHPMRTFDEFWPFYLRQHAAPGTRLMHYFGTAGAAFCLALIILLLDLRATAILLPLGLVLAYALAWLAHLRVERNRPATFIYPGWSLRADIKMFWFWLLGRLVPELEAAGLRAGASEKMPPPRP
jgi:hypothetical protein